MSEGTIECKTERGSGFLPNDRDNAVYFRGSAVERTTFDLLREGQRVALEGTKSDRAPGAKKVRPL